MKYGAMNPCPNCGQELNFKMLTSYPPIMVTECPHCGYRKEGDTVIRNGRPEKPSEKRSDMNFKKDEKVKIADSDEIGTVADKMRSEAGKTYYKVVFPDKTESIFGEDELSPVPEAVDLDRFDFEITLDNNLAIVRVFYDGKEISHNHGHIFNDGIAGAVQAVSYAFRRMWQNLAKSERNP